MLKNLLRGLGGGRSVRVLVGGNLVRVAGTASLAGLVLSGSDGGATARGEAVRPVVSAALVSATAAPTRLAPPWRVTRRPAVRRAAPSYYRRTTSKRVPATAERGFMPLYKEAEETFGVSWRLIASVHRQETAFSTVPGIYRGLNAFGCCAGPMQFNVTNGPVSTWELYRQSFRQGDRPRSYPNRTPSHPSVYDDFDAIMAAGALLRDGGATGGLDGGSWSAAYGYYGYDDFGTTYASQVLGRAMTWERDGFCLNCPDDAGLVAELDDLYGVDARRQLREADEGERERKRKERKKRRERRERKERRERAEREQRKDAATSPKSGRSPGGGTGQTPPSKPRKPNPQTGTTQTEPPSASTQPAPGPSPSDPTPSPPEPTTPPPSGDPACPPLSTLLGCGR